MKILIAEDDHYIRQGLKDLLQGEGYDVLEAEDGEQALSSFADCTPEFVLLDIMMPKLNGYDVCREIRKQNSDVPVIFISAKSEEIDRVLGLELGADDYIMKPFGTREVVARIRAVTRRYLKSAEVSQQKVKAFTMADLTIYPNELRAQRDSQHIDLSLRDVKILELLHNNKNKVVDRDSLFNNCWGRDYMPSSRTLDQHISKLRKLIEHDPKNPGIIRTVHGVGYRYDS